MFDFMTTQIPGVILIEPRFKGKAFPVWSKRAFEKSGIPGEFVQDIQSELAHSQIEGIYIQRPPLARALLIRSLKGSMYCVAVDLRAHSHTYGSYVGAILSSENKRQLFIPEGCAHAFLGLSDSCEYAYMSSAPECPILSDALRFDDPGIGIKWPIAPKKTELLKIEYAKFDNRIKKPSRMIN